MAICGLPYSTKEQRRLKVVTKKSHTLDLERNSRLDIPGIETKKRSLA